MKDPAPLEGERGQLLRTADNLPPSPPPRELNVSCSPHNPNDRPEAPIPGLRSDDVFSIARTYYSIERIRKLLPCSIDMAQEIADVVGYVAFALTGDENELEAARQWFQKRICIGLEDGQKLDESAPDQRNPPLPFSRTRKQKSTDFGKPSKKAPTLSAKKAPTLAGKKAPTNYLPRELQLVVGVDELSGLLLSADQLAWCSPVRLCGLLCLIDYLFRRSLSKPILVSSSLAHDFISPIKRSKSFNVIREPLLVLVHIGVLELVSPSVFTPHLRRPALYRISSASFGRFHSATVFLPPVLIRKLNHAMPRREARLNRAFPWRKQLLADLALLNLSLSGRNAALDLLRDELKTATVKRALNLLDGLIPWKATNAPSGQIIIPFASIPRELKAELTLQGYPAVSCDISHAHHCLLPRLLIDRIVYMQKRGDDPDYFAPYQTELADLRDFLSNDDYYSKWCRDPNSKQERQEKKKLLNMMLNWENKRALGNRLYRKIRSRFPLTLGIVENLRSEDHRVISKQLQHYTAQVINPALIELQGLGIPAIPDTDSIYCRERDKVKVCEAIGRKMYELTGVCCKVGGIRYPGPSDTGPNG